MRIIPKFQNPAGPIEAVNNDSMYPIRDDVVDYMDESQIRNGMQYWFMKGDYNKTNSYKRYLQQVKTSPRKNKNNTTPYQPKIVVKPGENGEDQQHVDGNSLITNGDIALSGPIPEVGKENSQDNHFKSKYFGEITDQGLLDDEYQDTELNAFLHDYKNRAKGDIPIPLYTKGGWHRIPGYENINIHNYTPKKGSHVAGFYNPMSGDVSLMAQDWIPLQLGYITPTAAHEISHWFRGGTNPSAYRNYSFARPLQRLDSYGETDLLQRAYPNFSAKRDWWDDTVERYALNTQFRTELGQQLSRNGKTLFGEEFDKALDNMSDRDLVNSYLKFSNKSGYSIPIGQYQKYGTDARDWIFRQLIDQNLKEDNEAIKKQYQNDPLSPDNPLFVRPGDVDLRNIFNAVDTLKTNKTFKVPMDDTWIKNLRRALKEVAINKTNSNNV